MKKLIILAVSIFVMNNIFGQAWSTVGNGVNGSVSSFAIYNSELYVGGQFYNSSGAVQYGLMKWTGTTFDTLPGTYLLGSGSIQAMAVYNNELYVGGGISKSPYKFIARWNGTSWNTVGSGFNYAVYSLAVYNGNLYAGGVMDSAGTTVVNSIAKWNGTQWHTVGNGIVTTGIRSIDVMAVYNNELYVAGSFDFPAIGGSCIARWNDTVWNKLGSNGTGATIYGMGQYNNELYVGGPFGAIGGIAANGIAKWNGASWSAVGSGINPSSEDIFALGEYHNELYAGGEFSTMNGNSIKSIARYNGSIWNSVGSGVDSTNIIVDTIIHFPTDTMFIYAPHTINAFQEFNNELYVGGKFNMIGGIAAKSIAKWITPLGIEEIPLSNFISVFPNPAKNNITIEALQKSTMEILNIQGQTILQQQIQQGKTNIDISRLAKGVYILRLNNNDKTAVTKILKE